MSAPSNGTELCPWDERRLPREMYVKLFVVHFTVLGAYAHLMHLRREPRYIFSFLLMIACPIAGVALVVVPFIALVIQTIICRGDRAILNQSFGILVGQVLRDEDTDEHGATIHWPPELSLKLVRSVVLQLALLAQCITSIWLFARRVKHGSDALYDHRIFQLAVLGCSASIMSILHLILRPQYSSSQTWHDYSAKIRWLAFLRPILTSERGDSFGTQGIPLTIHSGGPSETQRTIGIPPVLIDWIYACITFSIALALSLKAVEFRGLWLIWPGLTQYSYHTPYLIPFLVLVAVGFRKTLFQQPRTSFKRLFFAFFGALVFWATVLPWIACASVLCILFVVKPGNAGFQLLTLLGKPFDYPNYETAVYYDPEPESWWGNDIRPDWSRIWTYGHLPASFPCPQAWKDPAADYAWWLA